MTESLDQSRTEAFSQDTREPSVKTEEKKCLLCGAELKLTVDGLYDTRFGSPGSYDVCQCVRCGLEQTLPAPSISELKHLYETYYNFRGETGARYTRWRERFFFSFVNRLWSWLDGDISFYQRRGIGRLLDIGCNEGRGLRIYSGNGFQAEGLELNETAAALARQSGFTVHTCPVENFKPDIPFDVAVLSNVLEHSLDPGEMLRAVRRILVPGGQVWISCPNNQSWLRSILGPSWINWHVPFHIVHFSPATLRQLLLNTGFSQVEIRQITPALWVASSLITRMFAKKGRATRELRSPILLAVLLVFVRLLLFPALWLGNRQEKGDCLVVVAKSGSIQP
jgi:SAM-dependent methyltransferase